MGLWWWEVLGHLVARARAPCASQHLSCPEPSVEERLQKLHSEIKFALKVDNPVRCLLHSHRVTTPCCPEMGAFLSHLLSGFLEVLGN